MQAVLYGYRRVDMQQDKQAVHGFSCFIGYPCIGVEGCQVDKKWVPDEVATFSAWSPALGTVDVDFNPKGQVVGIKNVREK